MSLLTQRVSRFLTSRPDIKSAVIWGAGQVGDQLATLIEQQFPDIELRGIVDSSINERKSVDGREVYPVSFLEGEEKPDLIVIASIAFERKIFDIISERYPSLIGLVFRLSQSEIVGAKLADALSQDDETLLTELLFEFPDSAEVWDEFARRADTQNLKALYSDCARCLKDDG
ncbi:hypothetical protein [Lacimicrobium alkaliphilum]|uniref:CoA-binding domain-containing protein n=1 Tax=Lacimicrobium alkaliphilum TaxID=1526571 RepID=A0A0U2ZJ75_9ALTE|nr:hypothetical protein [Lacimicrobium alkaliphilum]ALS99063.1 hypothetical protein AT746_12845 [Lacimicrobium alkaliphilum]